MKKQFAPPPELDPAQCLYLTRGLSRLFWGLLFAMTLFFADATLALSKRMSLPAYVLGALLALWGARILRMAGAFTPRWIFLVRAAIALLALTIYFAPFLKWWKSKPDSMWFITNAFVFFGVSILLIASLSLLCLAAGRRMGHRGLRLESWICFASVIIMLVVPYLFVLAALCLFPDYFQACLGEIDATGFKLPMPILMVALAPCALTLVNLWKGREISQACLLSLTKNLRTEPEQQA